MGKKIILLILSFLFLMGCTKEVSTRGDLVIEGKSLISQKPPFTMSLPSEYHLYHFFSHDNPGENSRTRVYFYLKIMDKRAEEMFIIQISDKTNPQALPMTAPPLAPYTEQRMYSQGKIKQGYLEIEYLTQLMAWNPEASSLQPILKKGISIPQHLALQGQIQFIYLGEHGVSIRYSKDVNSFGLKISGDGKDWERDTLSGNEQKAYEMFQKGFMEMLNSITIKTT